MVQIIFEFSKRSSGIEAKRLFCLDIVQAVLFYVEELKPYIWLLLSW